MTAHLRQAMHDLADDRPPAAPPADLWTRGVRRARRRRAGGAAVAALVAVLAGSAGTLGWQHVVDRTAPAPAAPQQRGAIPDRLETPSRWTPGTDRKGPLGPLAVLAGAERADGWTATDNGLVGVSAATGEYRFVDLPGRVPTGNPDYDDTADATVLSPDGRLIGYWTGDATRVTGIAVYDTTTGEVVRQPFPSRMGLSVEALGWAEDDTLVVSYGRITERTADSWSSRSAGAYLWRPGSGEPELLAGKRLYSAFAVRPAPGGFSWLGAGLSLWNTKTLERTRFRLPGVDSPQNGLVAPDGRRVAVGGLDAGVLEVGDLPAGGGTARLHALESGLRTYEVSGWVDPDHVVVEAVTGSGNRGWGMYSVDVRTGAAERLVRITGERWGPGRQFAQNLWQRPTVRRPGPGFVLDPRWVAAAVAGLAIAVLALVRRRRVA